MKQRIVFVIGSLDYGGAERHLMQILPRLAREGWSVEVMTLSTPGAQAPLLRAQGIAVIGPPLPPGASNIFYRLLRLGTVASFFCLRLWVTQPSVVHFFLPQAYIVGGLASLASLVPRRVMSRRSRNFYQQTHRFMARVELFLHGRMDAVLGNSLPVVSDLRAEGVRPERLGLIFNGIELEPFVDPADRTSTRQALGIDDGELVIAAVANLFPYKGHEDLLVALSRAKLPPRWRLVCIGQDNGILDRLKTMAAELGIAERVIWAGHRTDIPDILAASDIGVLASHEEGFSNAVLEYMAAGLPVVATDVGGNSEMILDGRTGHLVPARDCDALAAALAKLTDAELRIAMGRAGRNRVETDFSLDRCVSSYDRLYRTLLSKRTLPQSLRADRSPETPVDL